MIKKTFKYKGQQVNYYNAIKKNKNIKMVIAYYNMTDGYVVEYEYK